MQPWYLKPELGVIFCLGSMAPGTCPFAGLQPGWPFCAGNTLGVSQPQQLCSDFCFFLHRTSCCWSSVSSFRCHLMSLSQSELPPHDGACFYLPRGTFSCLMAPPSSVRLLFCSVALALPPHTPPQTHIHVHWTNPRVWTPRVSVHNRLSSLRRAEPWW